MNDENPYKPPESEIADVYASSDAGGTLEKGVSGEYDFEIMDVIKESWERTNGIKSAYWVGLLIFMLIVFGVALLMGGFGLFGAQAGILGQMLPNLLFTAITYPFLAGIIMMGVHRAVDLPVFAGQVFNSLGFVLPVIIASMLVSVFTTIGFMLLVLPGIYLSVAYFLVMPLIVEKQLGAWDAMETSRKAITKRWFKVFGLFVIMGAIVVVSMFSIIGLFWTLPMSTVMLGVLYRIIFGVEAARGKEVSGTIAA